MPVQVGVNNESQQRAATGCERGGRLASALPSSVLHTLAEAIQSCDPADWPWSKARIAAGISQPHYRSLAASFLDAWQSEAKIVSPEAVAAALLTAAHS